MHRSLVRCVRVRKWIPFLKTSPSAEDGKGMTKDEQAQLKSLIPKIRTDKGIASIVHAEEVVSVEETTPLQDKIDMDSIRARGFMKYRFNYNPPASLDDTVKNILSKICPEIMESTDDFTKISFKNNFKLKFQLLDALGRSLQHVVPNPELHRIETVGNVLEFYKTPISNLTVYTKMARDKSGTLPKNLHIIEHPARFHPDDKEAYHGGVTAFPGRGGEVYGLRNKRLYRQFRPKEHWFDYEAQSFDYTRADKDMPWDPEIVRRMDQFPHKKYNLETKKFRQIRSDRNEIVSG